MSLRLIREPMRSHIIATIKMVARPGRSVELAVYKWEHRVLPERCAREGAMNRPDGVEDGCTCQGCFERDVAKLLEMLLANVKLPPSEWR